MLMESIGILAGVALFIYGIEQMSAEFQRLAGDKFRKLIERLTTNIVSGTAIGAAVSAIIQSSSATTVIAVSLINAGMLTFKQSLGIIAGANIGTTITAQLVAYNFSAIAPVFIVIGFILSLVGREFRVVGRALFFFGFLFFALSVISVSVQPFKEDPGIISFLKAMDDIPVALALGIILTAIFQSSSAVTGIAVLLAMEGFLSPAMAIPFVLGSNIGTTVTTLFAASKMDLFAKRAAAAHTIFNIFGVLIILPVLPQFISFTVGLDGDSGRVVANAHTIFNIAAAAVFILLSGRIAPIVERLVPGKEREIVFRTRYLESVPRSTPAALKAVRFELRHQMENLREMFDVSTQMVVKRETSAMQRVVKLESLNDFIDRRIASVLVEISQRDLTTSQSSEVIALSRISDELEKIGDICEDYAALALRLEENRLTLSPESASDVLAIKECFDRMLLYLIENSGSIDAQGVAVMAAIRKKADRLIFAAHAHRIRLLSGKKIGVAATVVFIDAISSLEHSNSALLRIARNFASTRAPTKVGRK